MPDMQEDQSLESLPLDIDIQEWIDNMAQRIGQQEARLAQNAVIIKALTKELMATRAERDALLQRLDILETEAMAAKVAQAKES